MSNLPRDCALSRVTDGEGWTVTDHLLATVIDALHAANWQRGGDEHATKPRPWPRPGDGSKREADAIAARARAFKARKGNG